jgi:hypothetical protein
MSFNTYVYRFLKVSNKYIELIPKLPYK